MSASSRRRVSAMCPAASGWRLPGPLVLCLLIVTGLLGGSTGRAVAADPEFAPWRPDRLPDLSLSTLDGHRASLDDHAGRLRLVHFFATWCEPCRPELASLETLRQRVSDRALINLAVDVGEPADRVRRFFDTLPVGFPILLDADKAAMRAWGVEVLPTTFVVDRDGCPLWRVDGDLDWAAPAVLERVRARLDAIPSHLPCSTTGDKP